MEEEAVMADMEAVVSEGVVVVVCHGVPECRH